jgi:hypothetical protein
VIEQAGAHHPAADDDDSCVCLHANQWVVNLDVLRGLPTIN